MGPQVLLPPGAGLVLEQVLLCGVNVQLTVRTSGRRATCTACGSASKEIHSSYQRHLADLPIAGRQVQVNLVVRRFRCARRLCSRRTFVEAVPALAERYARRTLRLRADLESIALALGGRPGSRLSWLQGKPTSRTTLLRLIRSLPMPSIRTPKVLGVDEFAVRRGRRYGTILIDVGTRRPIDLLEDPSADALVRWLGEHPGVEIVCRDRDGVYASAVRRGAPEAVQVADRWHLVHNLADALERFALRVLAGVRKAVEGARSEYADPLVLPAPPQGRIRPRTEKRHARIHELLSRGLTLSAIARQLGLDRRTVRRFVGAAHADDLLRPGGFRPSQLDPFVPYLTRRWREGCRVAVFLYNEVCQLGYRGSRRSVARRVAPWRTAEPPPPREALPGPRTVAWLLLRRPSELEDADRVLLAKLFGQVDELRAAHRLAQQFLVLVRERRGRELDEWAAAVLATGPPELRGFSRNLRRDWVAVQRGLTVRWSSGPVEGQITRVKLIKRQMFGRAKFDLLRRRVLLAS